MIPKRGLKKGSLQRTDGLTDASSYEDSKALMKPVIHTHPPAWYPGKKLAKFWEQMKRKTEKSTQSRWQADGIAEVLVDFNMNVVTKLYVKVFRRFRWSSLRP